MAEENQADKTEQASQKKLQQALEKGKISLAKDPVSVAALGAGFIAVYLTALPLRDALIELFAATIRGASDAHASSIFSHLVRPSLLSLGIIVAASSGALLATVLQTKGRLWPHLAAPDPERLWQAGKLKRLFTREVLTDLGLSAVKVCALLGVIWFSIQKDVLTLGAIAIQGIHAQLAHLGGVLADAGVKALAVMVVIAGADFALTRHRFGVKMRMTKEETRRELKEDEGDPLIRSQRRRRQRELAKARVTIEVPRADALLVNPTHVAVAIRYRRDESRAPKVIAKGKGQLAEIMRDLARSNGVPIVEDIPLARLLYRKVKVGREIPAETYKAVATILAFVYRITGRAAGGIAA